ncbi:universal stress protein [soil metagenome]
MTFKSILLNLDIDQLSTPIIDFGTGLAKTFDAVLIGLAAADVVPIIGPPDGIVFDPQIFEQQRKDIEGRLTDWHREFDRIVAGVVETGWLSDIQNPTRFVTEAACSADLIVMGSPIDTVSEGGSRSADLGSVVLNAGRPVLVAAHGAQHFGVTKALIAWKNTREARRAVADALPLLAMAEEVTIATVDRHLDGSTKTNAEQLAGFLSRHGIKCGIKISSAPDEGAELARLAAESRCDLIVSGAYGHSRWREWVFGGVTRSLLGNATLNRFFSS